MKNLDKVFFIFSYVVILLNCQQTEQKTEKLEAFINFVKNSSSKGEQLYNSLQKNISDFSPKFKYDIFKGYTPQVENKYQNLYQTASDYKLEGYTSDIITKIYANLYKINPYSMARQQPISFLNSDKFPDKSYQEYQKIQREQIFHHPNHTYDEHFPQNSEHKNDDNQVPQQLQDHANKNLFSDYYKSQFAFKTSNETKTIYQSPSDPTNSDTELENYLKFLETQESQQSLESLESQESQQSQESLESQQAPMPSSSPPFPRFKQNYTISSHQSQRSHFLSSAKLLAALHHSKQTKNFYLPVKAPIYIPFPIVSYYSVPVVDHYGLEQTVEKVIRVPEYVNTFHNQSQVSIQRKASVQKVLIPQAVPYGIKVPFFVK